MPRSVAQLRQDALRIWQAGLDAVRSPALMFDAVEVVGNDLRVGEVILDLGLIDRIAVVGGGKAAAGMAIALEQALGPRVLRDKQVTGWVNVPADCVLKTDVIALHAGREASRNEPANAGVIGVRQMLRLVGGLGPRDLCLCLISGGASALMPAPIDGFSLDEKIALTREMSARGATIEQMNAVRRALSDVKGGGLARACRAGRLVSLILSDVPGDDLATIGSGPTVLGRTATRDAMEVVRALSLADISAGKQAAILLQRRIDAELEGARSLEPNSAVLSERVVRRPDLSEYLGVTGFDEFRTENGCQVTNVVIGNNATAVDAAGVEAERLGYSHAMVSADRPEGLVESVAQGMVEMARRMRDDASGPDCLISGGEPTVKLAPPEQRGRGGRNQQLCLAALAELPEWRGLALFSGGTDGEDGPTDAAGACVDEGVAAEAKRMGLEPRNYLARNDAYSFFEAAGGLLKTGPTHTNVCDLRVLTVSRP